MAKAVEIRRHTDNDGDVLTDEGVQSALKVGASLDGEYALGVSTGAQRATQTLPCLIGAAGLRLKQGVIVETGLRSDDEDRWKDAYQEAGSGELAAFREVAPDFVAEDSRKLGEGLRRVFARLEDGERALAVGHSPTSEAAVAGLTGQDVDPLSKGEGVLVTEEGGDYRVERLDG